MNKFFIKKILLFLLPQIIIFLAILIFLPIVAKACEENNISGVICSNDSQCGPSGFVGSPFCQGNNVYQNYITWTCNNPGSCGSYCSSDTTIKLQTSCGAGQVCSNGSCSNSNDYGLGAVSQTQTCNAHAYQKCWGTNYLYWYDSCGRMGTDFEYCQHGCSNNACVNVPASQNALIQTTSSCNAHAYQKCWGTNYLYWYDSCGRMGTDFEYCPFGCSNGACVQGSYRKTVYPTTYTYYYPYTYNYLYYYPYNYRYNYDYWSVSLYWRW